MVRSRGLEPPRLAALAPQASASASSATTASASIVKAMDYGVKRGKKGCAEACLQNQKTRMAMSRQGQDQFRRRYKGELRLLRWRWRGLRSWRSLLRCWLRASRRLRCRLRGAWRWAWSCRRSCRRSRRGNRGYRLRRRLRDFLQDRAALSYRLVAPKHQRHGAEHEHDGAPRSGF